MADWHVYLLTLDIGASTKKLTAGENEITFTVTDDDTDESVEGVTVSVAGAKDKVEGTTDAEGKVTLKFTPRRRGVKITAKAEGFNPRSLRLKRR